MNLDLNRARLLHCVWRLRLRQYLEGVERIDLAEAVSPSECALGKWLYSTGLKKYRNWAEIATLESVHAQMHHVVERVVQFYEAGQYNEARQEYRNVEPLSAHLISLLRTLEQRINETTTSAQ